MAKTNLDYNKEWGILIHQLPREFMGKAMRVLPRNIKCKFFDESGMRVYFSKKEVCDKFIRKKNIVLDGILFNIYSTVTCLIVYGINAVATREIIETYLRAKDFPVYDLYQITNTDDYRIVLDVPEVSANIDQFRITLDSNPGNMFPMGYYCRVCRTEGHKQYQCLSQNSLEENCGRSDLGADKGRAHLNSSGNLKGRKASVTAIPNTRGQREDIRNPGNVSARKKEYLPVMEPSTSNTPTAAEIHLRTPYNMTRGRNRVSLGMARMTQKRSVKKVNKGANRPYPCREIIRIVSKTRGVLTADQLCTFLEQVHSKKNALLYAKMFTQDISDLIHQIENVIFHYNRQDHKNSVANKEIKILENLCKRLRKQMLSDTMSVFI